MIKLVKLTEIRITMENSNSAILVLKGLKYRVAVIQGLLKQAPPIDVKAEEINSMDPSDPAAKDFIATVTPAEAGNVIGQVVFYRQGGKYTVLMGQETAKRGLADGKMFIKGRLISSPGLKRARVEPPPAAPATAMAAAFQTVGIDRPARTERPPYNKDRQDRAQSDRPKFNSDRPKSDSPRSQVSRSPYGRPTGGRPNVAREESRPMQAEAVKPKFTTSNGTITRRDPNKS